MSVEVVEGTRPGWSVGEVEQIECGKEWAANKANDVYNAPEECLHDGSSPPLIVSRQTRRLERGSFTHDILTVYYYSTFSLCTTSILHQAKT